MAEYYFGLRHAHIGLALLSVSIFVLRGSLMLAQSPGAQSAWLRYPSYFVDTLLLTVALMLTSVIQQYPITNSWLTMKVALLVLYVVLGSIALRRGRTRVVRTAAFAGAILTIACVYSVARAHHPLGLFADSAPEKTVWLAFL